MNQYSSPAAQGQQGVFPRSELQADERVIFEGKPSMVAMCFVGIIWLVLCLGGGLLIAAVTFVVPMCALSSIAVALLAGIAPFMYFYVQWSGTSYALTDRRVLVHKTDASLHHLTQSLPLSHVTNTVRSQSFTDGLVGAGNIGFAAAAGLPGFMWPSVPAHDTVRPYIDQEIARLRGPLPQPQAPPMGGFAMPPPMQPPMITTPPGQATVAIPNRKCPHCGMFFGGDGAFCPYCGAKA